MNWSDISGLVGKAAPMLGTLVGGPAGGIVGGMIASALGTSATPDAVHAAIASDPAAAEKLAEVESNNAVALQKLSVDHAGAVLAAEIATIQADVEDRKSARERESTTHDTTTPRVLAFVVTLASVGLGGAIVGGWVTQSPALAGIVGTVIGYVFGESKQVLNYYFGSSSGSRAKDDVIAKAIPAAEPNAATAP